MSMVWGITGFLYDHTKPIDETFQEVTDLLREKGLVQSGDSYIITASMPLHWENRTNMLKLITVD